MTLLAPLLLACRPPAPTLEPAAGPQSGYQRLSVDLTELDVDPADVTGARLGSLRALELEADGSLLWLTDQGAPGPGPADLTLELGAETLVLAGAYTYLPPEDPVFTRFFAVGASLTQGVQGGVPTHHGQLHAPSAQMARQAGAFHPLALVRPGLFPEVRGSDIGPPPDCIGPSATDLAVGSAFEVLANLTDPETGVFGFQHGRLDPDLEPQNLAVGGMDLADVLDGSAGGGIDFVAHLVLDPYGGAGDPVPGSQIGRLQDASPTLVVCFDTYGNDVIGAVVGSDTLDLSRVTPPGPMQDAIDRFVDALAETGAHAFLANLPRPSLLPGTRDQRARAVAAAREDALTSGADPEQAAHDASDAYDALLAELDATMADYNARLAASAGRYPTIHVVDTASAVAELEASGLAVGDAVLGVGRFAGLLGTDGIHFSDVGYAMLANVFLDAMDAALGVSVEPVDLASVLAHDPYATAVLLGEGLDPACVDGP